MRSSTSHYDQEIPHNRFHSWWFAGGAVQEDVSLDDFLIYWLCYYQALGRHSHFPMPFEVVIEQGKPVKIPNRAYDTMWDLSSDDGPIGEDPVERFKIETTRQEIARELEKIEHEVGRLTHSQLELRQQLEALEAEQVEAIGRGEVLGPTTTKRHDKRRCRPRLSFPWVLVAGYLAIMLMTLFEAYQLAVLIFDFIGVDTTRLGREWHLNPLGVLSGAGFALSATAGLFYVWYLLICRAGVLSKSWDSAAPGVMGRRVAGIFFLSCALLVGTLFIANLRYSTTIKIIDVQAVQSGQASGTDMGTGVFAFLTLLVPFTAASLHHTLSQSTYWQHRRDMAANQAVWDRDEEARLAPAETFADQMALLQQRLAGIEQERSQLHTEQRALAERADAAQQQRLTKLKQARLCTEVFANSLIAALEEKRFYFIRAANRAKAFHLLPDASRDSRPVIHALLPAGKNGQVT
jgi:hypothetical protein